MAESDILDRSYTQKEWTELIEQMLTFLCEQEPSSTTYFYKTERQVLPNAFLNSQVSHFCYTFKGVFLPSGNLAGIVWKPSQGAKPAGKNLMKRYFYFKKDHLKINRQVIWLTNNENWCFLDYRYNFKGKIKLRDICIPDSFDLRGLLLAACGNGPILTTQSTLASVTPAPIKKSRKRGLSTGETTTGYQYDDETPVKPTFINNNVHNNGNNGIPHSEESFIGYSYEDNVLPNFSDPNRIDENDIFLSNAELDFVGATNSPPPLLLIDLDTPSIDNDDEFLFSKRPRLAEDSSSNSLLQMGSWEWTSPSAIFSSGLEYFFDMISHLICNQLLFQRRFFKKYGIDAELARENVKEISVSFDLREFPGNIIKSFFEYISIKYFQINSNELPTIYCIVCGNDVKHHDESKHNDFFGHLDASLVQLLQEKANNMYELIKQYIIFLLKNPGAHESLKDYLLKNLHCPFCSGTSGCHVAHDHKKWTNIWKLESTMSTGAPPSPSTNIYDYTKSTFEWLVDQVPFYIPPFLLSLHYVKYVRTFMECLVTCWNSVRLLV